MVYEELVSAAKRLNSPMVDGFVIVLVLKLMNKRKMAAATARMMSIELFFIKEKNEVVMIYSLRQIRIHQKVI